MRVHSVSRQRLVSLAGASGYLPHFSTDHLRTIRLASEKASFLFAEFLVGQNSIVAELSEFA
jgi:hypothetical protein